MLAWGPPTHHQAEIIERRRPSSFTNLEELLEQLPARVLLDRMPGAVLGIDMDGVITFANPAAVSLLGHVDDALIGRPLPSLLEGHADSSVEECLATLRLVDGGDVVNWLHADGFLIHTAVSTPLLLRAEDPYLMVSLTDVTELRWG